MDKISIADLQIFSHHGVFEEEKKLGQWFCVSADLFLNTNESSKTDNLANTVNYSSVCDSIAAFFNDNQFDLIETCANETAAHILLQFPTVQTVRLTVKKPQAPIKHTLDYVAVSVVRSWHTAYLSIGSNIGDKESNLKKAIEKIQTSSLKVIGKSSFYITSPIGYSNQEDFYNCCVSIKTLDDPVALLSHLKRIENDMGRQHTFRNGPRLIDLDILLYDQNIIHTETLCIPHLSMHKRRFVLEPLAELAPYCIHPILGRSIIDLKEMFQDDTQLVEKISHDLSE